jgi:hypothetical protein
MIVYVDYASPSEFESTGDKTSVGFSTNARRPVKFHGLVRDHGFFLRIALRALGEVVWSDDTWVATSDILDPVITVHPDRIFFEAFSQDQSTYGALIVDPAIFEPLGEVYTGTTNIDFTAWLWGALGEMRTSRSTSFRIGPAGLDVRTSSAGGRFEKKVEIPESWVRGFLQVQAAMAMPGTRVRAKAIDVLAAIRFLRVMKSNVSPRAMRYEFEPGRDARLILEPWEQAFELEGADHNYTELKTTRVWGRRRMRLIEGLLPFAENVDIYLKGRALPSFYAVKLPGMTFLLGVTGWSGSSFTSTGGFDLLAEAATADDAQVERALVLLRERYHASTEDIATALGLDLPAASRVLVRLCRQGRAMFDVETRRYRHRELFEVPADEKKYFPPDRRQELAQSLLQNNAVRIVTCSVEETKKIRKFRDPNSGDAKQKVAREITYRDWRVIGAAGEADPVEIVINDNGRIIFGRCTCEHFKEHLMNQGPCEHMLALFKASEPQRSDAPASTPATVDPDATPPRRAPSRWEVDRAGESEDQ